MNSRPRNLRIEDVSVRYTATRSLFATFAKRYQRYADTRGGPKALDNVSLDIEEGGFVSILGPSGCGKTTLLRVIAGLIRPDQATIDGRIYVGNREITYLQPASRHIALVPQSLNLYPHYSVAKNLDFPLRMRRVRSDERRKRVEETAELLGIKHLLSRKPKELSGGEKQRVALGKAMIRTDTIIELYDEPFSSLDIVLRRKLRRVLRDLHSQFKRTTLFVTHDPEEASFLSASIVLMRNGKLEQMGSYEDLFHSPKNLFAARLIRGDEFNLTTMRIHYDNRLVLRRGDFEFIPSLDLAKRLQLLEGNEVLLGFDIQDAEALADELIEAENTVVGELKSILTREGHKTVELRVGQDLFQFAVHLPEMPTVGRRMALKLKNERVYFFDPTSEIRI